MSQAFAGRTPTAQPKTLVSRPRGLSFQYTSPSAAVSELWTRLAARVSSSQVCSPKDYEITQNANNGTEDITAESPHVSCRAVYSAMLQNLVQLVVVEPSTLQQTDVGGGDRSMHRDVFALQQLRQLEQFGYRHLSTCICRASGSSLLTVTDVQNFFQNPTRLFTLLEVAYVFEAFYLVRDFFKIAGATKHHHVRQEPIVSVCQYEHPIAITSPEVFETPKVAPSPIETSIAFLSASFYSLLEILQTSSARQGHRADWQFVEKCLAIHILTRIPAIHTLKNYVPELLPVLLAILTNDNEVLAEATHRLVFNILKAFHRDFECVEAYLQISTSLYLQALHGCTSQLKPWNSVVQVYRESETQLIPNVPAETTAASANDAMQCDDGDSEMDGTCVASSYLSQLLGNSDPSLMFVSLEPDTVLNPAASSLKLLMEVPLMVMLLLQLNAAPVKQHSSLILERLLQFLSFLEPHKNYLKVIESLKRRQLPPADVLLLDFKMHRDLLDAQVKTLAFISFFLRGSLWGGAGAHPAASAAGTNAGGPQYSTASTPTTSPPMAEIGSIILEYLNFAPYQVVPPALQRFRVIVSDKRPAGDETSTVASEPLVVLKENFGSSPFDVALDHIRVIYCRREVLVAFRSITSSPEFRTAASLSNLGRALTSRTHLGTGLAATDSLKPFTSQFRVEIVNHIRCSESLQRMLLSSISASRLRRTELHRKHLRSLLEAAERSQALSDFDQKSLLRWLWRWDTRRAVIPTWNAEVPQAASLAASHMIHNRNSYDTQPLPQRNANGVPSSFVLPTGPPHTRAGTTFPATPSTEVAASPPSTVSVLPDPPSVPSGAAPPPVVQQQQQAQQHGTLPETTRLTYADVRALLLARSTNSDVGRSALPPADKVLPLSVLAELSHTICTDLHDATLPVYTQTLLIRALIVIVEWVDKLCVGIRGRQPHPSSLGPNGQSAGRVGQQQPPQQQQQQPVLAVNHFMDQKEAADIHRRILEACCNKLISLERQFSKLVVASRRLLSHRTTVSALSEPALADSSTTPDFFVTQRQSAWVNPPLRSFLGEEGLKLHPSSLPTTVELLKELKVLIRSLCQAVKLSALLLTVRQDTIGNAADNNVQVVGIPGDETSRENQESSRLLHAAPLNDLDFQTIRLSILAVLRLCPLYGAALSRCSTLPHSPTQHVDIRDKLKRSPPARGLWTRLASTSLLNTPPQLSSSTAANASPLAVTSAGWDALSVDKQLAIALQEERDLAEGAALILTSMHYAFVRRFLQEETANLTTFMSFAPSIAAFFESVYQHPTTATAAFSVITPLLLRSLSVLTGAIHQAAVRIPDFLGRAVCTVHQLQDKKEDAVVTEQGSHCMTRSNEESAGRRRRRRPREQDNADELVTSRKRKALLITPKGNVLVSDQRSDSNVSPSQAIDILHKFSNAPYLPLDIFEPSWSAMSSVRDIVDAEADQEALGDQKIRVCRQKGFEYIPASSVKKAPATSSVPPFPSPFLNAVLRRDHFPSPFSVYPTSLPDCPPSLRRLHQCHDDYATLSDSCASEEWMHTGRQGCGTGTKTEAVPRSTTDYLYVPRSASRAEASAVAPCVSLHHRTSRCCRRYCLISATSKYQSQPVLAPKLPSNVTPEDTVGRFIAYDPSLVVVKPCSPFSCNEVVAGSSQHPFSFCPLPVVADFAAVEGRWPGVDTLTHTASGCPRPTLSATYSLLWRLTLKHLCQLHTPQSGLHSVVFNIVSASLQRLHSTSRPCALLSLLSFFFRNCSTASSHTVSSLAKEKGGTAPPLSFTSSSRTAAGYVSDALNAIPIAWCLATLYTLASHTSPIVKDVLAEVALRLPVFPTNLTRVLPYYGGALLQALQSHNVSLLNLGLRAFETMIESLNPSNILLHLTSASYPQSRQGQMPPIISCLLALIEPCPRPLRADPFTVGEDHILRESTDPITRASYLHLHPTMTTATRNSISSYATRLLGVLGGTARAFLLEPPLLDTTSQQPGHLPRPDAELCFGLPLLLADSKHDPDAPMLNVQQRSVHVDGRAVDLLAHHPLAVIHLEKVIQVALKTLQSPHDAQVFSRMYQPRPYSFIGYYNFFVEHSVRPFDKVCRGSTSDAETHGPHPPTESLPSYPYLEAFPWASSYSAACLLITRAGLSIAPSLEWVHNSHCAAGSLSTSPFETEASATLTLPSPASSSSSFSSIISPPWSLLYPKKHIEEPTVSKKAPLGLSQHRSIHGVSIAPSFTNVQRETTHYTLGHLHAIEQALHPLVLSRSRKLQAIALLKRVLIETLDLDRSCFAPHKPKEPCPPSLGSFASTSSLNELLPHWFRRIIKGLLIGAGDMDQIVRSEARSVLLSTADYCAGLLAESPTLPDTSTETGAGKLMEPLIFVRAVLASLDLRPHRWAASCFGIKILRHILRVALLISSPSSINKTDSCYLSRSEFLHPFLSQCYRAQTPYHMGAAAWMIFELIQIYPNSWLISHTEALSTALCVMLKSLTTNPVLSHRTFSQGDVLAVSIVHETLVALLSKVAVPRERLSPNNDVARVSPTVKTATTEAPPIVMGLHDDDGALTLPFLQRFLLKHIVPCCFEQSFLLRREAFCFLHNAARVLHTTVPALLVMPLHPSVVSEQPTEIMSTTTTNGLRLYENSLHLFYGPPDVAGTLLGQMLIGLSSYELYRADSNVMLTWSALDTLNFLLGLTSPGIVFSLSFLLKCAALAAGVLLRGVADNGSTTGPTTSGPAVSVIAGLPSGGMPTPESSAASPGITPPTTPCGASTPPMSSGLLSPTGAAEDIAVLQPNFLLQERRAAVRIQALRTAKLVALQLDRLPCPQESAVSQQDQSFQQLVIDVAGHVGVSVGVLESAMPPGTTPTLFLPGLILRFMTDLDIDVGWAAQHALLVVGSCYAKRQRDQATPNVPCGTETTVSPLPGIPLASLFTDDFLLTHLRKGFAFLSVPSQRTAARFLALARTIETLKGAFANTAITTKLIDVAFALCDGCDNLAKQMASSRPTPSGSDYIVSGPKPLPRIALSSFSPLLSPVDIPCVAAGLISCIAALPGAALSANLLCRSALRLAVGLVDFSEVNVSQLELQHTKFATVDGTWTEGNAIATLSPPTCQSMALLGAQLGSIFTDFCEAHADSITNIVWSRSDMGTPGAAQTKFGLPFILSRGKTSAFICRALRVARSVMLRQATQAKSALMSRLLREALELQYPGLFYSLLGPGELCPSYAARASHVMNAFNVIRQDIGSYGSEAVASAVHDIIVILGILAGFDRTWLYRNWDMHACTCAASLERNASTASVRTVPPSVFHTLPLVLDVESPWTSTYSYPLIHCILDVWTVGAGLVLEDATAASAEEAADLEDAWLKTQTAEPPDMPVPVPIFETEKEFVAGPSLSATVTLSVGGALAHDDFHAFLHTRVSASVTELLVEFLKVTARRARLAYSKTDGGTNGIAMSDLRTVTLKDDVTQALWVTTQLQVLRVKLIIALCIPLALRRAQDATYVEDTLRDWFHPNLFLKTVHTEDDEDDTDVISGEEAKLLLRFFFLHVLYNALMPSRLKAVVARHLAIPILLAAARHAKHEGKGVSQPFPQREVCTYLTELNYLQPDPALRNPAGREDGRFAHVTPPDRWIMAVASAYVSLAVTRRLAMDNVATLGPLTPDTVPVTLLSTTHLEESEDLQVEALRLLKQLAELASSSMSERDDHDDVMCSTQSDPIPTPLCWKLCRTESLIVRHWSYYCIAHGLRNQTTFGRLLLGPHQHCAELQDVLKFLALLIQCPQLETRILTRSALDVVLLSGRITPEQLTHGLLLPFFHALSALEGSIPHVQILQSLCQLLVRHAHMLYPTRAALAPLCATALGRVALNAGSETRRVILDLVHTILEWELRGYCESSSYGDPSWVSTSTTLETSCYYTVKASLTSASDIPIVSRALSAMTQCLLLNPTTPIRFQSMLKCLQLPSTPADQTLSAAQLYIKRLTARRLSFLALMAFDIVLQFQDMPTFLASLAALTQTLDPTWATTDPEVIAALCRVVTKILHIIPPPPAADLGMLTRAKITSTTSPADIFWIRLAQVIAAGLNGIAGKSEAIGQLFPTGMTSGLVPFLYLPEIQTVSDNKTREAQEQRRALNSVIESLEKSSTSAAKDGSEAGAGGGGIPVHPYLSIRLFLTLTAVDVPFLREQRQLEATPQEGSGDGELLPFYVSSFPRKLLAVSFGLPALAATISLAEYLEPLVAKDVSSGSSKGSGDAVSNGSLPRGPQQKQRSHVLQTEATATLAPALSADSLEYKLQMFTELTQFVTLLFFGLSADPTTSSSSPSLRDTQQAVPEEGRYRWIQFQQDVDALFVSKLIEQDRLKKCQQLVFKLLLDLPDKLNAFGVQYQLLKTLGWLIFGPHYDPLVAFESSALTRHASSENKTDNVVGCGGHNDVNTSSFDNAEAFRPFDYTLWSSEIQQPRTMILKDNVADYTTYDYLDAWSNSGSGWECLARMRGTRRFALRSVTEILHSMFSPPTCFGSLETAHVRSCCVQNFTETRLLQILHTWASAYAGHVVPDMHLFYFDLVHRLLHAPVDHAIPKTFLQDTERRLIVIDETEGKQGGHGLTLCAPGSLGTIGIWVAESMRLLHALDWSSDSKLNMGMVVNLFQPLLRGALSIHPAVRSEFFLLLHHVVPKAAGPRLEFFLEYVAQPSLRHHPLSQLCASLLLLSHAPHGTAVSVRFPRFPPLGWTVQLEANGSNASQKRKHMEEWLRSGGTPDATLRKYLRAASDDASIAYDANSTAMSRRDDFVLTQRRRNYDDDDDDANAVAENPSSVTASEADQCSSSTERGLWKQRLQTFIDASRSYAANPLSWIEPLSVLGLHSAHLTSQLLSELIPVIWTTLSQTQQTALADTIVSLACWERSEDSDDVPLSLHETASTTDSDALHGRHSSSAGLGMLMHDLAVDFRGDSVRRFSVAMTEALLCGQPPRSQGTTAWATRPTAENVESTGGSGGGAARSGSGGMTEQGVTGLCTVAQASVRRSGPTQFVRHIILASLRCSPLILFPPNVLRRTATVLRLWYTAILRLAAQLPHVPLQSPLYAGHLRAIMDLCDTVGDTDTATAVGIQGATTSETRSALEDLNSGRWLRGQDAFNALLRQSTPALDKDPIIAQQTAAAVAIASVYLSGSPAYAYRGPKSSDVGTSCEDGISDEMLHDFGLQVATPKEVLQLRTVQPGPALELSLWADEWIRSSTQLNQWNSLNEISSCSNVTLTQDARSKLQDWPGVARIVTLHSLATPQAAVGLFYSSLQRMIGDLSMLSSTATPVDSGGGQKSTNVVSGQSSNAASHSGNQWAGGPPPSLSDTSTSSRAETDRLNSTQFLSSIRAKLDEMEELLIACQRLIVAGARTLPTIPGASHLRSQLLSQLQVEANEGFHWVSEFSTRSALAHANRSSASATTMDGIDNRALMMTWRRRLLSSSDDMRSWSDLLVWRSCFFTVVQSFVSSCPALSQTEQSLWGIYQQDVAWTILKFAQVANYPHELPDVALALLSKLHTLHTFFTCPAYFCDYLTTATRCIKLCQTPSQLLAALNLLQSIDLKQYPATAISLTGDSGLDASNVTLTAVDKLKAKLFVAKARVVTELPDFPPTVDYKHDREIDWSGHYARVLRYALAGRQQTTSTPGASQQQQQPSGVGGSLSLNSTPHVGKTTATSGGTATTSGGAAVRPEVQPFSNIPPTRPTNVQEALDSLSTALDFCPVLEKAWATYASLTDRIFICDQPSADIHQGSAAVMSYIMAAYLSPHHSRRYLSRVLWLMTYDDPPQGHLSKIFGKYGEILPSGLWLSWIPELIASLERREHLQTFAVLLRLAEVFPQAVFYHIRATFRSLEALASAYSSTSNSDQLLLDIKHDSGDSDSVLHSSTPPAAILQAQELCEQLLSAALMTTPSGPVCLAMDYMASHLLRIALPTHLEEILRNIGILQARLLGMLPESLMASPDHDYDSLILPLPLMDFLLHSIVIEGRTLLELSAEASTSTGVYLQREDLALLRSLWEKDFCWATVAKHVNEDAMSVDAFNDPLLKFTVGSCLALLRKWSQVLNTVLQTSLAQRRGLCERQLNDVLNMNVLGSRLYQMTDMCLSENVRTLYVPGATTDLLYRNSFLATVKGTSLPDPQLLGMEVIRVRLCESTVVSRRSLDCVSFGTDNGRLTHLCFESANGVQHSFVVQPCTTYEWRSEERSAYLLGRFTSILATGKEARRRTIGFAIPITVPLHPFCRLTSYSATQMSLEEMWNLNSGLPDLQLPQFVYVHHLRSHYLRLLADPPLSDKPESCKDTEGHLADSTIENRTVTDTNDVQSFTPNDNNAATSSGTAQPQQQSARSEKTGSLFQTARRSAYFDVCSLTTEDVIKDFIWQSFSDQEQLYVFHRKTTADFAIWSLLSYALCNTDVTPDTILFEFDTARIQFLGFRVTLDPETRTLTRAKETVPFRLTRNLQSLMGALGRLGRLPGAMFSVLDCFASSKNESTVRTYLNLLLRDELWDTCMVERIIKPLRGSARARLNFHEFPEVAQWLAVSKRRYTVALSSISRVAAHAWSSNVASDLESLTTQLLWASRSNTSTTKSPVKLPSQYSANPTSLPPTPEDPFDTVQLRCSVEENVASIISRFESLYMTSAKGDSGGTALPAASTSSSTQSCYAKIHDLLDEATDIDNLAAMGSLWSPWI